MMTEKQASFIISLCNKISGAQQSYLSQHRNLLGWSSFQLQRGISKAEASAKIDELKAQLPR